MDGCLLKGVFFSVISSGLATLLPSGVIRRSSVAVSGYFEYFALYKACRKVGLVVLRFLRIVKLCKENFERISFYMLARVFTDYILRYAGLAYI